MTLTPAPNRWRNRLRVGILAVAVMSVAVALLVWASRPRWHTVVSPVVTELGVALSFQVRRFRHPVGNALELKLLLGREWFAANSGMPPPIRQVIIFRKDALRHRKGIIVVSAGRPELMEWPAGRAGFPDWPEWEEIVRRIRLVPAK